MLSDAVDRYVQMRRYAGFQLRIAEAMLRDFALVATEVGDRYVRAQTAIGWAARATTVRQRVRRLSVVAQFAKHVWSEDPRHEITSSEVFATSKQRPIPHIYSPDEVSSIVAEAGRLGPVGSLRPATFQTLFGLIAAFARPRRCIYSSRT